MFQRIYEIIQAVSQLNILLRIGVSSILLLFLILLSKLIEVDMEKTFFWSFLRGFLQILLMGSLLIIIFGIDALWFLYLVLLLMCLFASYSLARRYPYPYIFPIVFIGITISSLVIMSFGMLTGLIPGFVGIIPYPPTGEYVITIGSTVIANTMSITIIVLERIKSDILKERGKIEAALALGAPPAHAMKSIIQQAIRAGLQPTVNTVAILGIVKIPGWMSGMIVGGISPVSAAVYQIIIYLMILSSAFLACVIISYLFTKQLFTSHQQLNRHRLDHLADREKAT